MTSGEMNSTRVRQRRLWRAAAIILTVLSIRLAATYETTAADDLVILTSSLPGGTIHQTYGAVLQAAGGDAPYSWSIAGGALPPGLHLNADGIIAGRPRLDGSFTVEVRVDDAAWTSAQRTLSMTVIGYTLTITTASLPSGMAHQPYALAVMDVSGGSPPYEWNFSGQLPPGLSFYPETGAIDGVPTEIGLFSIRVMVEDSQGRLGARDFSIAVLDTNININLVMQRLTEEDEELHGGFVHLNTDDDNDNDVGDDQESGVTGENDLVAVHLHRQPSGLSLGSLTLSVESYVIPLPIRVWTSPAKSTQLLLPQTWSVGAAPAVVWVEGVGTSEGVMDTVLRLTYSGGVISTGLKLQDSGSLQDQVSLSVPDSVLDDPEFSAEPPDEGYEFPRVYGIEIPDGEQPDFGIIGGADIRGGNLFVAEGADPDRKNFSTPEFNHVLLGALKNTRKDGGSIVFESSNEKIKLPELKRVDKASSGLKFNDGKFLRVETFAGEVDITHPTTQFYTGASLFLVVEGPDDSEITFVQTVMEGSKISIKKAGEDRVRTWAPPDLPRIDVELTRGHKLRGAGDDGDKYLRGMGDTPIMGGLANGLRIPFNNVELGTGDIVTWTTKFRTVIIMKRGETTGVAGSVTWGKVAEFKVGAKAADTTRKVTLTQPVILLERKDRDAAAEEAKLAERNGKLPRENWREQ